jgi:hypothetical protein
MSLLFDKLAEAGTSARQLMVGPQLWCRGCDRSGDELAAAGRHRAKRDGEPEAAEPFVLIDLDQPTGLCRICAERFGWHRFFFSSPDFLDGEAA